MAASPSCLISRLWRSRWFLLVASSWVETCTGLGTLFATYSPAIKASLKYNQKQISRLGVAKDLGNSAVIIAGFLSTLLPSWALLLLGALQFLLGYGCLWLIVVHKIPTPPFCMLFILVFVGANAQKFMDMAAVVSCLPSFTECRGSLLGILKAFKGLSGAVFLQVYTTFFFPDQSAALLMVAVGPALIAMPMMFIVRPIGHPLSEGKRSEAIIFRILYSICLLIAGYLVIVLFFQDSIPAGDFRSLIITAGLLMLTALPLAAPLISILVLNKDKSDLSVEAGLIDPLLQDFEQTCTGSDQETDNFPELEHQKSKGLPTKISLFYLLPHFCKTTAEGKVQEKGGKSRQVGDEFTVMQAIATPEFWLLFFALYCGLGPGSTALDNLGQMAEAQGYQNGHIFMSIFSISSFTGHLVGGYISEVVVRDYALPRSIALIAAEGIMLLAQFLFAMAWPGAMYPASLFLGLAFGSFSSINPTISSELFGLKSFGTIFGLLTIAAPASSFVLSGLVAGTIYDWEAEKQHGLSSGKINGLENSHHWLLGSDAVQCKGQVCFYLTCWIMVVVCAAGMGLSGALSLRTRVFYSRTNAGRHHV